MPIIKYFPLVKNSHGAHQAGFAERASRFGAGNRPRLALRLRKGRVIGQAIEPRARDGDTEREDEAYQRFMDQHQNIIRPLIDLCQANGINRDTNGQPMLYTFSLGRFYVGGVYQYDPTDANKLVEVLRKCTTSSRKGMFGSGFKAID